MEIDKNNLEQVADSLTELGKPGILDKPLDIVEIFSSIDGEGTRTGKLVTFIRVYGCNCRCTFCDTPYSYAPESDADVSMTIGEILKKVNELGNNRITLTGGEPLIHKNIRELLYVLTYLKYEVNIETNGSVPIRPFKTFNLDLPLSQDKMTFTIDWKSPSSGMNERMLPDNLYDANPFRDVIKFVVGSKEDLEEILRVLNGGWRCSNIYISPVFGDIELSEIVDFMKEHNLQNCTLQVQLHKIIWPPEMRGV